MGKVKLFVFFGAALAVIFALALLNIKLCFKGSDRYTFFCGNTSMDCKEVTSTFSPALKRLTLNNVCGESAYYNDLDIEKYLQSVDGEVVFVEETNDSINYYCKANLPYGITLYGQEINLHISKSENGVKVGSPIIFGGY